MAHNEVVESPYSKFKEQIVKKLVSLKFIKGYVVEGGLRKKLNIELLYHEETPAMTDIKIFSKPGRRYYVSYNQLKPVLSGFGYSVLSTSKGILTNKEVHKDKIGGELLFNIW